MCRVDHFQHSTPSSQVEEFLALWVSQPRFALALYTRPAGCGKPGQIQVGWTAFLLALPWQLCTQAKGLCSLLARLLDCLHTTTKGGPDTAANRFSYGKQLHSPEHRTHHLGLLPMGAGPGGVLAV